MALLAPINEKEEGYQIKEEDVDGFDSIYLIKEETKDIVENIRTSKKYTSIKEALQDSNSNEEIQLKLLDNIDLNESITIKQNENVTLDLAGKVITNRYWKIENQGIFTIDDYTGGGKIENKNVSYSIRNTGNLNINGGVTISRENDKYSSGNVQGSDTLICYGIYNSGGVVNLQNGIIFNKHSNNSYGIYNVEKGQVNILNGEISAIATISNCYAVSNNGGKVRIVGGKINSTGGLHSNGIYNANNGTIDFQGGQIYATAYSRTYSYCFGKGISNEGNGIVNISGGKIISESGDNGCEIKGINNNSSGVINITGGESTAIGISWRGLYGIFNNSTGTINLGIEADGIVSSTMPNIKVEDKGTNTQGYGISNVNGKFNFYDGRIEGTTLAKTEKTEITKKEESAEFKYENDNKILYLITEAMEVAKVGDTTYTGLKDAIDAVGNTKTTIELLRGIELTKQDTTITIGANQDITLDLKGFNIISAVEDSVFTNKVVSY